jgi:hypothetical protein
LRRFALAFATRRGWRHGEEVLAGASPAHRHMPACARRVWPNMRAAYRRMLYCTAASADVSCLGVAGCPKQPQYARGLMQCRIRLPGAQRAHPSLLPKVPSALCSDRPSGVAARVWKAALQPGVSCVSHRLWRCVVREPSGPVEGRLPLKHRDAWRRPKYNGFTRHGAMESSTGVLCGWAMSNCRLLDGMLTRQDIPPSCMEQSLHHHQHNT